LNNDHLTPTWVAEKLNISPGYLHMLFKEEDTSVSNWIKLSREELAEPR
jgi:AraC-like DNA-binding protein